MSDKNEVLIIDAGNTSIKAAIYQNDKLMSLSRFLLKDPTLETFLTTKKNMNGAISSVLNQQDTDLITRLQPKLITINSESKLPISLDYLTPKTLGVDRICNASGMLRMLQTDYGVAIDIGTCIKFDLVSKSNLYLGGSISPGIDLRYQSLHDYTGNLPLLSNKNTVDTVGKDTVGSIQSGVINGIKAEIEGMMKTYQEAYKSLTFFVTGGDAKYFELHSKNDIFADDNLTINGLFEIYTANA